MQVLIEDSDSESASSESICPMEDVDTSSSEKTHRSTGDRIILHFYITFYNFLPEWYNVLFSFCCPVLFDALPFVFDYGLQQTLQSSFL